MASIPAWSRRGLVATGFLAFVLLVGSIATPPARAQTSSTLHIGVLDPVDSLSPFRGTSESSRILTSMLYDFLFSVDENGSYVPNLATGVSCDATCTNWSYTIRQGVHWSDGTPFTASDVAFTVNYAMQNFAKLNAFELYLNQVVACRPATKPFCGAVMTAPWTVTVYFTRPFVAGQGLFVPILQAAQWQGISPNQAQTKFDNPNPIGTGPFIADPNLYSEWLSGQPLHIVRNPNYHPVGTHSGAVNVSDLYLQSFADENSLAVSLLAGTIDLAEMSRFGFGTVIGHPNVMGQEGLPADQRSVELGFQQLSTNNVNGKLNPARWDTNVRRAVAMTMNKDYVSQSIYSGNATRGTDLLSPVLRQWFYDPTLDPGANLTYNLTAANALLDAAGYTVWSGGSPGNGVREAAHALTFLSPNGQIVTIPAGTPLAFTLAAPPQSLFPAVGNSARLLQATAVQVGIQFTIKFEATMPALQTDIFGGNVETYITFHVSDPDPNLLLSQQSGFTLDGHNDNYLNNATYNAEYLAQLGEPGLSAREADVRAAQATHYAMAAYVVLVYPYGAWAWRTDRFSGWGDWNAHPFRQIDNVWGANPLFFDLSAV